MLAMMHKSGPNAYGKIAWRQDPSTVAEGLPVMARSVEFLDGSTPEAGQELICGSCGMPMQYPLMMSDFANYRVIPEVNNE